MADPLNPVSVIPDSGVTPSWTTGGWGLIRPGDRKAHYYLRGFSLCRRIGGYRGELDTSDARSPDDCAACRKKLDKILNG